MRFHFEKLNWEEVDIRIRDNEFIFESCICFRCGKFGKAMTKHHAIPKRLKPEKNVIVSICHGCHDDVNDLDMKGILGYFHRLFKKLRSMIDQVDNKICKFKEEITNDKN